MSEVTTAAFMDLVAGRRGHFQLESGHHGGLWLDLDDLFAEAKRIEPFVEALSSAVRPYEVTAVCGPLLGGAFLAQWVAQSLGAMFCFTERVMGARTSGMYPASYRLPRAFRERTHGARVAIVDDVMSAGSALRGTYEDLRLHGAIPVVAGALLVLGSTGAGFFAAAGVPVEAVTRDEYELWPPEGCPLCKKGEPLQRLALPTHL